MNKVQIIEFLEKEYPSLPLHKTIKNPFHNLIATILYQITRDDQIIPVVNHLFSQVKTPEDIINLPNEALEKIIKSAGKYRQNTRRINKICTIIIKKYKGFVPNNEKDLLSLPGVGRKTANIILSQSFNKDVIAVDIHVHRISNRLGWVKTKNPSQTEHELQKIVPRKYWIILNRVFVSHGQTICKSISPFCTKCKILKACKQIGVYKNR